MQGVKREFDLFVVYHQRFIETHLNWYTRLNTMMYKRLEERLEVVELVVRLSDFLTSDDQQNFFTQFRETYMNGDPGVRQMFIESDHSNDSVIFLAETLEA